MDRPRPIISRLPLDSLQDGAGWELQATRTRALGAEDIRALLHARPVRFVVANVGHPLRWIDEDERFTFWKAEVLAHLLRDGHPIWRSIQAGTTTPRQSGGSPTVRP